jgi:hypothetical protein
MQTNRMTTLPGRRIADAEPAASATHRERLLAGLPLTERRLSLAGIPTMVLEGGQALQQAVP